MKLPETDEIWFGEFGSAELRGIWGDRLRTIPEHLIAAPVSAATRRFLSEIGLPADPELPDVMFVFDDRLSAIVRRHGRDLLILTDSASPIPLALDLATDQILVVYRDESSHLFNTSIAAAVFFLGLVTRDVLRLQEATEQTLPPAVEAVWDELVARDRPAMQGKTPWQAWLDDLGSQYE